MNSSEIQKRFGKNLRFIRKQKKLTQFQLAELANVSEDTIKSIVTLIKVCGRSLVFYNG